MLDGFISVISVDCGIWRTVMSDHDPIFDMNCQNILAFGEIRFFFGNRTLLFIDNLDIKGIIYGIKFTHTSTPFVGL